MIVPVLYKDDDSKALLDKAFEIKKQLVQAGIRCVVDDRDNHKPAWKYNDWEVKGVPIRFELGGKDYEKQEVRACVRSSGKKQQLKWEGIDVTTNALLETIQADMYNNALKERDSHIKEADNWEDFMNLINAKNIVLTPWCDIKEEEVKVQDVSKEESLAKMLEANEEEAMLTGSAKILCIPYQLGDQNVAGSGKKCFFSGKEAKVTALWGRSY